MVTLFGTVSRGPVTPVCEARKPCTIAAAHVKLTFIRADAKVVALTDGSGHYRVRLAPGTYTVRSNVGMSIAPAKLTVRGTTLRQNLAIDTGIR